MDANALLRLLAIALGYNATHTANHCCLELYRRLSRDAATPTWAGYPSATEYYRAYVARLGRD